MSPMLSRLYGGERIIFTGNEQSNRLARRALSVVGSRFGPIPESLSPEAFKTALAQAREDSCQAQVCELAAAYLQTLKLCDGALRMDKVRLRAVPPGLEDVPEAAPVFYAHRDTWYGNPPCQINVWMPLDKVDETNSFRFYTDFFERPISNDSQDFVAEGFRGFGKTDSHRGWVYPRALLEPTGEYEDVCMELGQVLFFSAAHLHQTLPNSKRKVRFSLDFRFFLERDLTTERGAPDPDNASRGLMVEDYSLLLASSSR